MSISDESVTAIELVDPLVGTIFDKRFRVEERLAAGGFGAIYKATHVKSGHQIALKVLHPTLASDLGVLARFRREGTTLTSLRNPHTITAYEFGQADKTLFIVLELLHGESLFDHYSVSGPMEWPRVVHIAKQVCESLEEAHAQGIVHRDLKPTNIHLEEVGSDPDYVKVLDFGIAKIVRGSDHDSQDITNAGQMIGTLDYMSPEQMVGGQVTGQTDIYTLGILMYEMIAGTRPFPESTSATGALAAMLRTTPEPLYLRAPVPRELDAVVMRCLERDTDNRFRSVGEVRAELERIVADAVPSATATVMVQKRAFDDNDETTVTPPPERILDALRAATTKRPSAEGLDSARTPRLDLALAKTDLARVPILADDDDSPSTDEIIRTTPRDAARARHTPTLEAMNTPRLERKPASEWDDDDERAPTTTRRPDGYDETPSVSARAKAPIPDRPPIRPFESRHVATPVPQVVVAPFSQRTPPPNDPNLRPPSGQIPPLDPRAVPPHSPTGPVPPFASAAPGFPPPGYPAPGGHVPTPGAFPQLPPTPIPGGIPATPGMFDQGARPPTAGYDMGGMAARDTAIRRLIWILVLVVAAGVGFVIATQL